MDRTMDLLPSGAAAAATEAAGQQAGDGAAGEAAGLAAELRRAHARGLWRASGAWGWRPLGAVGQA